MKTVILVLLVLVLSVFGVYAQEDADWRLADVQDLLPMLEDLGRVDASLSLSPDGMRLAWAARDRLCLYEPDTQTGECHPLPETFASTFRDYNPLRWSPDGADIAFTEDPFYTLTESDVWVYKLASGEFTNLTDDGVEGSWLRSDDDKPVALDYAMTWHPTSGDLYFFRSERFDDGWTIDLYRTDPGNSEPEQISSFTFNIPTLSIYFSPAISPDGKTMALIVLGQKPDDPKNGVWTIDLEDGAAELVANLPTLTRNGFPEWQEQRGLLPRGVTWAGNNGLLVYLFNGAFAAGVSWGTQYIDLTSAAVTPLVDMSAIPEAADLFSVGDDGRTTQHDMVRSVLVAPDGEAVIYDHYDNASREEPSLSALALPPEGEPDEIGTAPGCVVQKVPGTPRWLGHIAPNGRAVLYNCLLTFEQR